MEDVIDIYHLVIFGWKVQIALDHIEAQGPQPYQKLLEGQALWVACAEVGDIRIGCSHHDSYFEQ